MNKQVSTSQRNADKIRPPTNISVLNQKKETVILRLKVLHETCHWSFIETGLPTAADDNTNSL